MGTQLTRWDGLVTIATGILLFLWWMLVTTLLPSLAVEVDLAAIVRNDAWVLYSLLGAVGTVLLPIVIVSVYIAQTGKMATLGRIGLYLSLVGAVAFAWVQIDQTLVWPVLLEEAPELVDLHGPMFGDALFASVYWLSHAALGIGLLLLGVATARAKVFPRWAGILLAFGGPVVGAGAFILAMRFVGILALTISLVWIGYLQWRDRGAAF